MPGYLLSENAFSSRSMVTSEKTVLLRRCRFFGGPSLWLSKRNKNLKLLSTSPQVNSVYYSSTYQGKFIHGVVRNSNYLFLVIKRYVHFNPIFFMLCIWKNFRGNHWHRNITVVTYKWVKMLEN